jgi:hypothetical protein
MLNNGIVAGIIGKINLKIGHKNIAIFPKMWYNGIITNTNHRREKLR